MKAKQKIKQFEDVLKKQSMYFIALQKTFWRTKKWNEIEIEKELKKLKSDAKNRR